MKIFLCFCVAILTTITSKAQYYYNDICTIRKLNKEYDSTRIAGHHLVALESFEDDDTPSKGFFCEKKFNADFSKSYMVSKSYITGESVLRSEYANGRVVKVTNETPTSKNTNTYLYDSKGNLLTINITTFGDADSISFSESRTYQYDDSGSLKSMTRTKNGKQFALIHFKKDTKGNIIEETPERNGSGRQYYYYYDDNNRMTDIVHFNEVARKLLPDYIFEYDPNGMVKQMISVDESGSNYFIWRYSYTANDLPEIQKCYSKEKRLLGTIQYEYR